MFVVLCPETLVTMLVGLFTGMWYITLYMFPYMQHGTRAVLFFREGEGSGLLCCCTMLYYIISVYDMRISRPMRVIWDVHSVLLSYPYFGHYLLTSVNNHTQSMERIGEDDFPQFFLPFFSFRPVTAAFENSEFPLDVK